MDKSKVEKISVLFEKMTIGDLFSLMNAGDNGFLIALPIMDKVIEGGIFDRPLMDYPRIFSVFNIELEKFASYMNTESTLDEAFNIAKKKWEEDGEKDND